ncbi:MAG: hypothetical protein AAGF93_12205 [Cyanobacteria bacterium P01_H01_bin.105]
MDSNTIKDLNTSFDLSPTVGEVGNTRESFPFSPTAIGVAVGNGFVKASDGTTDLCVRSQALEHHPQFLSASDDLLLLEAVESPCLIGQLCIGTGLDASPGVISLANGLKGKYYAAFALAAVARLVDNGAFINLAVSLPSKAMEPMLAPLRDSHTVLINGKRKHFVIDQIRTFPEGLGTAMRMRELRASRSAVVPSFAALDFGHGNTTVVAIDGAGNCSGFGNTPTGVGALFEEIAQTLSGKTGGIPPTVDAVRLGVQLGTFCLNGHGSISFVNEYDAALQTWTKARLQELHGQCSQLLDRAEAKVVCGGGANLPGLMELMPNGYAKATAPQKLEAQGLQRFARAIHG